jgi:hypothetical protein
MAIWGWALLGTERHGREWHKVRAVQNYGKANWARYMTACDLRIAGTDVESSPRAPTIGPLCPGCLASPD